MGDASFWRVKRVNPAGFVMACVPQMASDFLLVSLIEPQIGDDTFNKREPLLTSDRVDWSSNVPRLFTSFKQQLKALASQPR